MAAVTRVDQMQAVLRKIRTASADIVGSAILTGDGFVVASLLPAEIDEEMLSALAATLLGAGEQIAEEIIASQLEQTFVKARDGYVIVNAISEEEVLIILTNANVKLGLVFMEGRKRSAELMQLL